METKEVRVVIMPGHEFVLQSDAPDIDGLVSTIVQLKGQFDPNCITIECEHEGFDKASFKDVVIGATNDFLEAIRLDKAAYEAALATLPDSSKRTN
ncbi:MAG: hypothetical protein IJI68_03605 [Eggerthellaceae bacterium]|nr:hypothetical protein [Eggerthellaceae bacterium]